MQTCVNLVDLVKSFQTSISYLLANIGVDTAENEPLKVCKKKEPHVGITFRKSIGARPLRQRRNRGVPPPRARGSRPSAEHWRDRDPGGIPDGASLIR